MSSLQLPVIDLREVCFSEAAASRFHGDAKTQQSVSRACETYGMFHVAVGPHVMDIVSQAFNAADALFALPETIKTSVIPLEASPSCARGYLGLGSESGSTRVERKEAFSCGYPFTASEESVLQRNDLQARNVWPRGSDEFDSSMFREAFESLFLELAHIAVTISNIIASVLGDPGLAKAAEQGLYVSLMRCFHYFARTENMQEDSMQTGSSQHTDWGLCSVIAQRPSSADCSALQLHHDNEWHDVSYVENSLTINCGDYLHISTCGRFRSPLHRVQLIPRDRTSFVYFHYPDYYVPMPKMISDRTRFGMLSLMQNQSESALTEELQLDIENSNPAITFGKFIAQKWLQVSRAMK